MPKCEVRTPHDISREARANSPFVRTSNDPLHYYHGPNQGMRAPQPIAPTSSLLDTSPRDLTGIAATGNGSKVVSRAPWCCAVVSGTSSRSTPDFGRWQDVTLAERQCTDYDKHCTDCMGIQGRVASDKVLGLLYLRLVSSLRDVGSVAIGWGGECPGVASFR